MPEHTTRSSGISSTFLAGLIIGGVLVALFTPKNGEEFRSDVRDKIQKAKKRKEEAVESITDEPIIDDNNPIL